MSDQPKQKLPCHFRFAVLRRYQGVDKAWHYQRVSTHKKWDLAVTRGRTDRNFAMRNNLSSDYYIYDMIEDRALTLQGNEIKDRKHSIAEIYGMPSG